MLLLATATSDPTGVLLNYGAIGAILVLLGIYAYGSVKRERERADRLETQLQTINDRINEKLADLLKETRDALVESSDYLRDLARRRRP
jgi:hypothetical protein